MRSIEALSAAAPGFTVLIKSAVAHLEPVELFGRLPERNELLGRESSDEEVQYLKDNPTACAPTPCPLPAPSCGPHPSGLWAPQDW